jgi:site-specific DNA-cytosine methylase
MNDVKPKLLDLFCGGKSVARVAEDLGYLVTTLDIDPRCNPDVCADILEFDYRSHFSPGEFDIVWSSPPCTTFSAARRSNIGRRVRGEVMTAKRIIEDAENIGVPILRRTQEIIEFLKPHRWYVENPYTGSMKDYIAAAPYVFDYCTS